MSDKPSLYVVEKKEVVILVILFVLVTVLSFTMGVRYGETVGKKSAIEQVEAEKEMGGAEAERVGGTLGGEKTSHGAEESHGSSNSNADHDMAPVKEAVDKNTDEYLLNALKETGVEPPGGTAPGSAELPEKVKTVLSGSYVIQVGSHPTRTEAENHLRQLKAKNIDAEILEPFKDRQGEWHRVVVGSFKSKRDAEKEAKSLKSKGAILSFFVWRLP